MKFFIPRNEEGAILTLEKVRDILVAGIHSLKCNSKAWEYLDQVSGFIQVCNNNLRSIINILFFAGVSAFSRWKVLVLPSILIRPLGLNPSISALYFNYFCVYLIF